MAVSGRLLPQVMAMKYSFDKVVPEGRAAMTRLHTAGLMDDYGEIVDTFQAPRNVRSNPYSPYNNVFPQPYKCGS